MKTCLKGCDVRRSPARRFQRGGYAAASLSHRGPHVCITVFQSRLCTSLSAVACSQAGDGTAPSPVPDCASLSMAPGNPLLVVSSTPWSPRRRSRSGALLHRPGRPRFGSRRDATEVDTGGNPKAEGSQPKPRIRLTSTTMIVEGAYCTTFGRLSPSGRQ